MLGILVQLSISWFLLWFIEKKHLSVLGLAPSKSRAIDFLFGFMSAALCCVVYYLALSALSNNRWALNPNFTATDFLGSTWWNIKSVLFEEFIFRGALLYILIQRIGIYKACIASSIAFGIYHWFSQGVFGNPGAMTYWFFSTAFWGLMYAMAFAKTKSLYMPIAMHLGWNLFVNTVFSQSSLGHQLFINSNNGQQVGILLTIPLFLFNVFALPLCVYWYLKTTRKKITAVEA
jgi:uncharacterized protein